MKSRTDDSTKELCRCPIKASDIFQYLTVKKRGEISAMLKERAAAQPPFVPEQNRRTSQPCRQILW